MIDVLFFVLVCVLFSIRFAPPLVISEEELLKAVRIIEECLFDLDKVRSFYIVFD